MGRFKSKKNMMERAKKFYKGIERKKEAVKPYVDPSVTEEAKEANMMSRTAKGYMKHEGQ